MKFVDDDDDDEQQLASFVWNFKCANFETIKEELTHNFRETHENVNFIHT